MAEVDAVADVRKRPFPDTCAALETIRGTAGRSLFETSVRNRDRAVCLRTRFGRFIDYKAANAGGLVAKVNPRGTSQGCDCCGPVTPKTLSDRIHDCPGCGTVEDRDVHMLAPFCPVDENYADRSSRMRRTVSRWMPMTLPAITLPTDC